MADGISSGGGFGETLFDATKKAVGGQIAQTVQAIGTQVTGKPIGSLGGNATSGTFNLPKAGGAQTPPLGKMPGANDFGKFFEKNQLGGQKQQMKTATPTSYKTPQQLEEMATQQQAIDAQKVAALTQELHQMYAKKVISSGDEALKKEKEYMENQRKEDDQESLRRKEAKKEQNAGLVAPGQMQAGNMSQAVTAADRSGESGKHTG